MKLDVYNETVVPEWCGCVRQFLGTVDVNNPGDAARKICQRFFDGDEDWARRCAYVVRHGKKVKRRAKLSKRRARRPYWDMKNDWVVQLCHPLRTEPDSTLSAAEERAQAKEDGLEIR